jgi:hypothetical protein
MIILTQCRGGRRDLLGIMGMMDVFSLGVVMVRTKKKEKEKKY